MKHPAPAASPLVAIVTVNYNGGAFIEPFLEGVRRQTYPTVHLVAVDCASTDGSDVRIERICPEATLIRSAENLGFTGGNNLAVSTALAAGAQFILFLNNDTEVPPDLVDQLMQRQAPYRLVVPRVELLGSGGLLDDTAGRFDWQRGIWRDWVYGKPPPAWLQHETTVEMASLCCLLAPADVFRHAGLLDERLFMYYEDFDWVRRAQGAGYRIWYVPDVTVQHRKSASSGGGDTPFKLYYATRNRVAVMRRHSSPSTFVRFSLELAVTRLLRALLLTAGGRGALARAMLAGWRDAYTGRMGRTFAPPGSSDGR